MYYTYRWIYIYIYIYLAFEGEKGYSELLWVWTPSGTIEITCLFLNCRVWAMPSTPCPDIEGNIEAAETVGKISVYCHAFKNHVVDIQTILGPFSP